MYAARLLAGQLPDDIDRLLAGFGLSLFPESCSEIAMDCSCPTWQVPCRHLTATCYALAESFDTDPFGILAWRGRAARSCSTGSGCCRSRRSRPTAPGATAGFWTAGRGRRPRAVPGATPPTRCSTSSTRCTSRPAGTT